jgi:DnaJ-class molecular chaperone
LISAFVRDPIHWFFTEVAEYRGSIRDLEGPLFWVCFGAFLIGLFAHQKISRHRWKDKLENINLQIKLNQTERRMHAMALQNNGNLSAYWVDPKTGSKYCPACEGSGERELPLETIVDHRALPPDCAVCEGEGYATNRQAVDYLLNSPRH